MRLEYALKTQLDIFGKKLNLNLAFDNILRLQELQEDEELSDSDKADISLRVLVRNYKAIKKLDNMKKTEILNEIFRDFINIKVRKVSDNTAKVLDFSQDAAYVYSSFMQDYGIDLLEQQGKLDWRKFIALFQGLSDHTKIKEVMSIRAQKIPAMTKYNAEQIKALYEAKAYYALDISEEEAHENVQRGLAQLAAFLKVRAKEGENRA